MRKSYLILIIELSENSVSFFQFRNVAKNVLTGTTFKRQQSKMQCRENLVSKNFSLITKSVSHPKKRLQYVILRNSDIDGACVRTCVHAYVVEVKIWRLHIEQDVIKCMKIRETYTTYIKSLLLKKSLFIPVLYCSVYLQYFLETVFWLFIYSFHNCLFIYSYLCRTYNPSYLYPLLIILLSLV